MQVSVPAKLLSRVVDVESLDVVQPDFFIEYSHSLGIRFRRAQVVAGSESMAGIEADADARLVCYASDNLPEIGKVAANDALDGRLR